MSMDLNDLRSLYTVLAFVTFIGIVVWVYGGKRKAGFEEAGRLPLTEDDPPASHGRQDGGN
ncbi:MAG: CcoQ/FixQ family Cbb3-type cytochrome c oxidase assembly chaperone [Rhodocyclaceae bacterium]